MSEAYEFRPEERPAFPGSPFSPMLTGRQRAIYAIVGAFLAATSTFGNALTTVNTTVIAGELGIYAAQAAAFPAIYVAVNASANLTVVKARTQFGIPQVTGALLVLYAFVGVLQFIWHGFAATIVMRAASAVEAAALITLGVYYLMQAMPAKIKPVGAVIGLGVSQIGTPLARVVPVDVVTANGLWGLHAIEVSLALFTLALILLALILLAPLPPSEKSKVFAPLDLVTIVLATTGMVLLCQVIGQGRTLWWADTRWLGLALAAAIPLLIAAFLIEVHRAHPLVHFEWIGTWGILRFALVALVLRLALAEQTYGSVGLLTLGGLNNDQLRGLFLVIAIAMLLGTVAAVLTLKPDRLRWQIVVAALIIAAGAWLDSDANALTRPAELFLSQALIGFGTTLFIGPGLLYGFIQMIQRGPDYLVSFIVTFSITQNVGGLMGSALLGTMQTIWAHNAAGVLAANLPAGDPLAAARVAGGAGALSAAIVDPLQRAAQGAGLLGQTIAREAGVIAFTDTFRLVAVLAVATAAFVVVNIAITERLKRRAEAAA
jgi:hypothetical protein